MAVNDLMMRIQILADTGKSSAELKNLQNQLKALSDQVKTLERTSLTPLANDLKTIKSAQDSLKATNLQTFAKTLEDVKKSFSVLSLPTKGIDDLKKGYEDLEKQIRRTSIATDQHAKETTLLNTRLTDTKKNQLTGDGQSVNQQWVDANKELKNYGNLIKVANEDIRTEKQLILDTKKLLKSANSDYQSSLVASGKLDLSGLKTQLTSQKEALKQSQDGVKYYRESLKGLNEDMRNLERIGKSISAKKLIDTATLFPGTQINKFNRDLESTNGLIKLYKENLKSIQNSSLTFTDRNGNSVRSIGTIKDAIAATKTAIVDAGKVKFDPQVNVGLAGIVNGQKIAFNETFDSLQKYNSSLSKQKENIAIVSNRIKSYQDTLRNLRLESQQKSIPDFTLGGTKNLIADLNQYKSSIRDLRTNEILPLRNELINLSSIKSFQKAVNIAPLDASVATLKAQNAILKEMREVSKGDKSAIGVAETERLTKLIDANRNKILLKELNSAVLNENIVNTLGKQIANTKSLLNDKQNSLSLLANEEKNVRSLIASERERAKFSSQEVKTRSGGILDVTGQVNQQRILSDAYKGNISILGEYYQSLKRIASVAKENAAKPLSTLFTELENSRKLEASQKAQIANKQKDADIIKTSIESEKARYTNLARLGLLQNQYDRANLQARIDARDVDLKSLQGVSETVKSRIAGTREEIAANKEVVKARQDSLQSTIFESQQKIASGQLTKQQYQEERTLVRTAIAEQKELSKVYQQQLRDHKDSLNLALKAEQANAKSLQAQVRDLTALNTEAARTKAVDLGRQYNASQGNQSSIKSQIAETEAQARAEISRIKALESSAKAADKARGGFLGLNAEFGKGLGPLREFGAAVSFMFGPQIAGFAFAGSVASLAASFFEANKEVEQLLRGLNAISGGNGEAEFRSMVTTSNRLGISIHETAHSFLQLEATTAGTAIAGANTKRIFESFSRALNVTGADATTFNRAFRSISQMLSKGQLYAEELKGQLAEALPGAIQVFSKALDVTPEKFLALTKAGAFAGKNLSDLLLLVAGQLDKTYKVGSENDFTFVQKANLAKNAFVELSVAIGNTGIWKELSNTMLYIRDILSGITRNVDDVAIAFKNLAIQNKEVFSSIINDFGNSFNLEINTDNVKFNPSGLIQNLKYLFQLLPDVVREGLKPVEDAFAEFNVAKAFIDIVPNLRAVIEIISAAFAKLSTEKFRAPYVDQLKTTEKQIADTKSALFSLQGLGDTRNGLSVSINPRTNEEIKQIDLLKSKLVELEDQRKIMLASSLEYFDRQDKANQGFDLNQNTLNDFGKVSVALENLKESAKKLKSEGTNFFGTWKTADLENSFNAVQVAIAKLTSKKASIGLELNNQQMQSTLAQAKTLSETIDEILNKRTATIGKRDDNIQLEKTIKIQDELSKRERGTRNEILSSEQAITAENEKNISITKNQIQYEKKLLDLKQAQRDANVEFEKAQYQSYVKSGSLSQESADFLTRIAQQDVARQAIKDAQDAVEKYNAEVLKGKDANSDTIALYRDSAVELLKLGAAEAKKTGDQYKYNQLVKETTKLYEEQKNKSNEATKLIFDSKLRNEKEKADAQAKEVTNTYQESVNQQPPIEVPTVLKPSDQAPPQVQSKNTDDPNLQLISFDRKYKDTNQLLAQSPLTIVVDDSKVAAVLQDLNQYQSKIQDIRTQSLDNQKTEIIITPKVNEQSVREDSNFVKTAFEQNVPQIQLGTDNIPRDAKTVQDKLNQNGVVATIKELKVENATINGWTQNTQTQLQANIKAISVPVSVDVNQAKSEGAKAADAVSKAVSENSNYDLFRGIGNDIAPQIQKAMGDAKSTVKSSVAEMNQDLIKSLYGKGYKITIDTSVDQKSIEEWKSQVKRLTATDANLSFPVSSFQVKAGTWEELVAQGNQYMKLNPTLSITPETISATAAQVNQGLNKVQLMFDPSTLTEEQRVIIQKLQEAGAEGMKVFENADGTITIYADNNPALTTTQALIEDINQRSATLKVYVQYIDNGRPSSSSSTSTSNNATGGFIHGYGGGDRIHAMLEQGEFVLRKEAVRKLGLNHVWSLNNLNIPNTQRSIDRVSIPSFSSGGYVGSSNTININVPGSKAIQVSGSRESAMALANLLTRVGRAV